MWYILTILRKLSDTVNYSTCSLLGVLFLLERSWHQSCSKFVESAVQQDLSVKESFTIPAIIAAWLRPFFECSRRHGTPGEDQHKNLRTFTNSKKLRNIKNKQ